MPRVCADWESNPFADEDEATPKSEFFTMGVACNKVLVFKSS